MAFDEISIDVSEKDILFSSDTVSKPAPTSSAFLHLCEKQKLS